MIFYSVVNNCEIAIVYAKYSNYITQNKSQYAYVCFE